MELVPRSFPANGGAMAMPMATREARTFRQWRGIFRGAAGGIGCSAGQAAIDGLIRISILFLEAKEKAPERFGGFFFRNFTKGATSSPHRKVRPLCPN